MSNDEPRTPQSWRDEFEAAKQVAIVREQNEQAAKIVMLERRCDKLYEQAREAWELADSHKVTIGQLQTELDAATAAIEKIRTWLRKKFPDEANGG